MTLDSFKQKFDIHLSEPKTVNSGTTRVMINVQSVSLVEKHSGTVIPTRLHVQGVTSKDELLLSVYDMDYSF